MSRDPPARRLASPPRLQERRAIAARSRFLRGLVELWQSKRRDDALPARGDFPIDVLRPWIGCIARRPPLPAARS